MKLYHGSRVSGLLTIRKSQAQSEEDVEVPKDDLLDAIYVTPDYGYALIMAARPNGTTHIDTDEKIVSFEHREEFDPEREVSVYEVDVPDDQVRQIDELQYVIENADQIKITAEHAHKASDIQRYFEVVDWNREKPDTAVNEINLR